MYSYLKCIVYDKMLKPRQSFWITLYMRALFRAIRTGKKIFLDKEMQKCKMKK